ncbi:GGDEF domain-containing protein [Swaminathania salitolerans]|uniref:GGDEF domain-containing protein n=1 Tax=Swaminathania salitolerans TaxID=182838 RepID=UPI0011BDAA70|nr:GGDEF domain-containing protein [Swaminathania salitolerans]
MNAFFSKIMRSPPSLSSSAPIGQNARNGHRSREIRLQTALLEALRAAVSVSDGLKDAFTLFCATARPDRGVLMSSGPLIVPEAPRSQLHLLKAWPPLPEGSDPDPHGFNLISTNLSIRAITPVRHQGDIGIIVYFPRRYPARDAESARRVLVTLVQTAAAMIEVDHRYRVLLRSLPYDPLTHLPIWSLFKERVERRLARLDRETLPATLMLVCFSGLLDVRDDAEVEADDAITQITHVRDAIAFLQRAIRPTDIIGQVDRESYTLWLDGGDRFASVERAEQICRRRYLCSAGANPRVSVKIGLVTREPGSSDTLDSFFERARLALSIARERNADWHFAHENA